MNMTAKAKNTVPSMDETTPLIVDASVSTISLSDISSLFVPDALKLPITLKRVNLFQLLQSLMPHTSGQLFFSDDLPELIFEEIQVTPNLSSGEYVLTAKTTAEDWMLPIGIQSLSIGNLCLAITYQYPKEKGSAPSLQGNIKGELQLGGNTVDLCYDISGEFSLKGVMPTLSLVALLKELCGDQGLNSLSLPSAFTDLSLNDANIQIYPHLKQLSLSADSSLGRAELTVCKGDDQQWGVIAAFSPPSHWHFSMLNNALSSLDNLSFSGTTLIISSGKINASAANLPSLSTGRKINSGLTCTCVLDTSDLGVSDLMGIKSLRVSTPIGNSLESIKLSAQLDSHFRIQDGMTLEEMTFFLSPAPSQFELGVSGTLNAHIGDSDLTFIGTMTIEPVARSASFAATMLGTWHEPFSIKGLALEDLAIEVGIGIVPPPAVAAPIIGLAGNIAIGNFRGSGAVKFDSANPSKSMIAASFNQLYLKDVVKTFCSADVYHAIPKDIRETALNAGLKDVDVHVVPQDTSIGELHYEAGFTFQGCLSIAGFNAQCAFALDYDSGFAIKASMDPIVIGDIFHIAGVDNVSSSEEQGPLLDVDLRRGGSPFLRLEGAISLLGMATQTDIAINDHGFSFDVEGKVFDLFQASITAKGDHFEQGGHFYLNVEMRNDLISYLREQALEGIEKAANSATEKLSAAQKDIEHAQSDVNSLNNEIKKMRGTIKKERARDTKKVNQAKKTVEEAQSAVDAIQGNIDQTRKTIGEERERDTAAINKAKNAVACEQKKVDKLQRDIRNQQQKIDKLKQAINDKKRWYNKSKWYQKSYRWAEFSAYSAAKGTEITGIYASIGGLETAKGTAKGALEVAKQFLAGVEKAAKTFPIDADPRIVALFSAKETASLTLEGAKVTLQGVEETIKHFPIDADPRIVGLFTALETATAGLKSAELALEGVKVSIGGLAEVGGFILEYGLGGVLDIKYARFEGELNQLSSGHVALALETVLMKQAVDFSLAFNFHDLGQSVERLVESVLQKIK